MGQELQVKEVSRLASAHDGTDLIDRYFLGGVEDETFVSQGFFGINLRSQVFHKINQCGLGSSNHPEAAKMRGSDDGDRLSPQAGAGIVQTTWDPRECGGGSCKEVEILGRAWQAVEADQRAASGEEKVLGLGKPDFQKISLELRKSTG